MDFTADQIVDKILHAAAPVPVKFIPRDDAPVVRTIPPGNAVGKVYSFLSTAPDKGRGSLYWVFRGANNINYYVAHKKGRFDLKALLAQTTEPKEESTLFRLGKMAVKGFLVIQAGKALLKLVNR